MIKNNSQIMDNFNQRKNEPTFVVEPPLTTDNSPLVNFNQTQERQQPLNNSHIDGQYRHGEGRNVISPMKPSYEFT